MKINETPPPVHHTPSQPANEREIRAPESSPQRQRTDKLEISSDAKRMLAGKVGAPSQLDTTTKTKEATSAQSQRDSLEVGNSAQSLANALTASGMYTDADEAQKVARKILEKMSSVASVGEDKLEKVQHRLESGFYGSREVAEQVAEKLLSELNMGS